MIKTTTTPEAWEVAYKIADAGEYELDKDSQERAGYPIYRAKESYYSRICDLGCRLEVVKARTMGTPWPRKFVKQRQISAKFHTLTNLFSIVDTSTRPRGN